MSSVVEDITPFLPGDTVACLRIADSDRQFPFRAVSPGMFLIGQGPSCDLRLGMPGIPSIHSIIQLDAESAQIIRVADQPELLINGEPVERCPLLHGDVVEIGEVRLSFQRCHPPVAELPAQNDSGKNMDPRELVEQLESEITLIDSAESGQERIQELLKAAQAAAGSGQFAETLRFVDYAANDAIMNSSDDAIRQVILVRLKSQEHRLDAICHVLEQVVQQQQLIATSLQSVAGRLDDLRTVWQTSTLRASA